MKVRRQLQLLQLSRQLLHFGVRHRKSAEGLASGGVPLTFALRYFVLPLLFHQDRVRKELAQKADPQIQEDLETLAEDRCRSRVVEDHSQMEVERWYSQGREEVDRIVLVDGRPSHRHHRLFSRSTPMLPDLL